jgi:homoserine dehydrogenase
MPNRRIVLKLGGSVLLDEASLRRAVHEIYRWRREGWAVVAVVSAFAGRTDHILDRCARLDPGGHQRLSPFALAAALGAGEAESAAFLGAQLDRAGVPATVLSPGAVGLRADGDPLDADPREVDTGPIESPLARDGVVVFPGFVALDAAGRAVTLGRGGSDITALFLAHALAAGCCRLVKDVDGLYESDPNAAGRAGGRPRRFETATWADARRFSGGTGSIVQAKAVDFAEARGLAFELGRWNGVRPTVIGPGPTRFSERPDPSDRPVRLDVAVLGAGVVGGGVVDLLRDLPDQFRLVGVACRSPGEARDLDSLRGLGPLLTGDALRLADHGADVVVEAIGGCDTAAHAAARVLLAGSHLVTANKTLLAERGGVLQALADAAGRRLLGSAAVGGAVPVLERVAAAPARSVRGVLNGTANFVLERLAEGAALDDAVEEARDLGLAEADPTRDLDGRDALDKLAVLRPLVVEYGAEVAREPIDDARRSCPPDGHRLRQVATCDPEGLRVAVERVGEDDPLHDCPGEWNAVVIERTDGSTEVLRGRGAGRWPTAESVLGDLLELAREAAGCDPALRPAEASGSALRCGER